MSLCSLLVLLRSSVAHLFILKVIWDSAPQHSPFLSLQVLLLTLDHTEHTEDRHLVIAGEPYFNLPGCQKCAFKMNLPVIPGLGFVLQDSLGVRFQTRFLFGSAKLHIGHTSCTSTTNWCAIHGTKEDRVKSMFGVDVVIPAPILTTFKTCSC